MQDRDAIFNVNVALKKQIFITDCFLINFLDFAHGSVLVGNHELSKIKYYL